MAGAADGTAEPATGALRGGRRRIGLLGADAAAGEADTVTRVYDTVFDADPFDTGRYMSGCGPPCGVMGSESTWWSDLRLIALFLGLQFVLLFLQFVSQRQLHAAAKWIRPRPVEGFELETGSVLGGGDDDLVSAAIGDGEAFWDDDGVFSSAPTSFSWTTRTTRAWRWIMLVLWSAVRGLSCGTLTKLLGTPCYL